MTYFSHLAFNFPLAKLYTNSLMSSLNSRAGWRYQSSETTDKKSRDVVSGTTRRVSRTVRRLTLTALVDHPMARLHFPSLSPSQLDVVNLSTVTRPEVHIAALFNCVR